MADGGYRTPLLWLSAGWAMVQAEGWTAPLYWEERADGFWSMTLRGAQPVDPAAPVAHVSYFEADAFAAWAGRRSADARSSGSMRRFSEPLRGNFVESGRLRPAPAPKSGSRACARSTATCGSGRAAPSLPIRAFARRKARSANTTASSCAGSSCCAAARARRPASHMRPAYRNFFPPDARWQFSGLQTGGGRLRCSTSSNEKLGQHEAFRADVLAGLARTRKRRCPAAGSTTSAARSCSRRSRASTNII